MSQDNIFHPLNYKKTDPHTQSCVLSAIGLSTGVFVYTQAMGELFICGAVRVQRAAVGE